MRVAALVPSLLQFQHRTIRNNGILATIRLLHLSKGWCTATVPELLRPALRPHPLWII
jgi:hypothetical protein